jgi:ribosomal protein S16
VAVAIRIADVFHVSVDQLFNLEYDGKPRHREQTVSVAVDRAQATEKPVEIVGKYEPLEKAAERQVSLADLRKIIGS